MYHVTLRDDRIICDTRLTKFDSRGKPFRSFNQIMRSRINKQNQSVYPFFIFLAISRVFQHFQKVEDQRGGPEWSLVDIPFETFVPYMQVLKNNIVTITMVAS